MRSGRWRRVNTGFWVPFPGPSFPCFRVEDSQTYNPGGGWGLSPCRALWRGSLVKVPKLWYTMPCVAVPGGWGGKGSGLTSVSYLIWWVHLPWLIRVMIGSGYLGQWWDRTQGWEEFLDLSGTIPGQGRPQREQDHSKRALFVSSSCGTTLACRTLSFTPQCFSLAPRMPT